ncbi:hypothetical protein [Parasitella parasitica]|uniref:Uncharacterized protein n=1 Tax=Parasitella parasitica TaxID=35722 RepID=A0A0B7NA20_9FUNG|nr:hypothetical protein [Parasitella parasitica]
MSNTIRCKKSSSLNKKASHGDTPNDPFSHTWSASTSRSHLRQQQCTFDVTNYIISTLPIETRIDFYEKKYQLVMESETQLSSWIKATRENAPPPSKPSFSPMPSSTRSRLPDFLFSSLSTRPKRKSQVDIDPSHSPTPKSSISTFLKKASGSLTPSYSKQPSKRLQTNTALQQDNSTRRFSLTSSLNRLSLSRNASSIAVHSEEPPSLGNNEKKINSTNTTKSKYKRFSTPHIQSPSPPSPQKEHRKKTSNYSTEAKRGLKNVTTTKVRPQSNILPQSSSSIFLERLRSRSPISEISPKSSQQVIQPNIISSQSNTFNSNSSIGTMDEDTPPASPSSSDSYSTPPLSPHQYGGHQFYFTHRGRRRSQELFFQYHATVKPSLTMMANITENRILEQQEEIYTLSNQTNNTSNINNNISKSVPAAALPLNGGDYSVMNTTAITTTATQTQQAKKKRASILTTPSFSSIRLISQKSQFLKRQSMLA